MNGLHYLSYLAKKDGPIFKVSEVDGKHISDFLMIFSVFSITESESLKRSI